MTTIAELDKIAANLNRDIHAVKIPFWMRFKYWMYYVLLAHKGTIIESNDKDVLYKNGFFKNGYEKYHNKINSFINNHYPRTNEYLEVPTFQADELTEEQTLHLMKLRIPFVIKNGAEKLKMMEWDLDFFADNFGDTILPINTAPDKPNKDPNKPNLSINYYDFKAGTIGELIESIKKNGNLRSIAFEDVMHEQDGRLIKDLDIPMFERVTGVNKHKVGSLRQKLMDGKIAAQQMFLQPKYAYTVWHCEPGDNFFILHSGKKTWTLAHPYHSATFNPGVKTNTTYHGSSIDIREDDVTQDKRGNEAYTRIPKLQFTVEKGDYLRLPNYWWHTVETCSDQYSIAVTLRAICMPNFTSAGYLLMRLLDKDYHELAKRIRSGGRMTDNDINFKIFSHLNKKKNQF